ncbi:MAG TPA: hypothetical protein VMF50_17755, partial [Candidatus Binataceae bacterium]|nr:hypothetical protein [Candidatus Binataceae bacterium]
TAHPVTPLVSPGTDRIVSRKYFHAISGHRYDPFLIQTARKRCDVNCRVEVLTEGHRVAKICGNKAHPDTRGRAEANSVKYAYSFDRKDE